MTFVWFSFAAVVLPLLLLAEFSAGDWNISTPHQYENNSSTTKSPGQSKLPSSDRSPASAPATSGLRVLYRMSSKFLDVIQPPGKNLYDELQMESKLVAKPNQILEAVVQSFSSKNDDPRFFIRYWVGFVVCVAFGILFIVVMPVVGLSMCLCRCCCHRCGHEKMGTPEQPRDRPKRICLGILLFFFTLIILAGTVCAFMSNELVRQQTISTEEGGGLLPTVLRNLEDVEAFKQATVKEVHDLLVQLNGTLNGEIDKLKKLPNVTADRLRSIIGTEDLVENISTLNRTLIRLADALRVVDADSDKLRNLSSELSQSLATIQRNLTVLCDNGTHCHSPDLTSATGPNLNQMPNIRSQLTTIDSIVSQGINVPGFENISQRIEEKLQTALNAISNLNISGTLMGISSSVKSAAESLNLKPLMDGVNSTKADVDKYGSYRFNVCVAISSLLLLIVLLIFIGLCIGVHSKAPYDVDSTSGVTRWTAAQCLMASVVIMFIFCSVLMAIVTVLFVSGGIIYTDGCRGFDQQQQNALVKIVDSFLRTELGNVSLYGALRDCKNDVGIVKALNLDEKFKINDRFNLSNLRELDIGNELNLSSISPSQFQFSGPKSQLEKLQNSSLMSINFTALNDMLNDTRSRSSLTEAISRLNETAQQSNQANVTNALLEIVQQLQNLSQTIVVEITNTTEDLRISLKELNETLYVDNSTKSLADFLSDLKVLLERTENKTMYDAPRVLQELVNNFSSNAIAVVRTEIDDVRRKVLTEVGRCSPISTAVENTVSAVCHSALDPFNAFWFSYGWCVFLFIPTIAVALVLAQLCWRLDVPIRSYSDASCYDAYKTTAPEEYLRLHNLTVSQQDLRRQPDANGISREPADLDHGLNSRSNQIQGNPYATNPGYVDYGDNDRSQLNRDGQPGNNGIDFYRGVGRHGNGTYDNPAYVDNDSNSYRIPRPTTAPPAERDDAENRGWHF